MGESGSEEHMKQVRWLNTIVQSRMKYKNGAEKESLLHELALYGYKARSLNGIC